MCYAFLGLQSKSWKFIRTCSTERYCPYLRDQYSSADVNTCISPKKNHDKVENIGITICHHNFFTHTSTQKRTEKTNHKKKRYDVYDFVRISSLRHTHTHIYKHQTNCASNDREKNKKWRKKTQNGIEWNFHFTVNIHPFSYHCVVDFVPSRDYRCNIFSVISFYFVRSIYFYRIVH